MSADSFFRAQFRNGIYQLLSEYHVAHPGTFNTVYRAPPQNYGDRPFAFIHKITEVDPPVRGQVAYRELTAQVIFVWAMTDDGETADIRDDVVDNFWNYAITHPHASSSNSLTEPRGNVDQEVSFDGSHYPATVQSFFGLDGKGRGP